MANDFELLRKQILLRVDKSSLLSICQAAGINRSVVYGILNGNGNPSLSTISKIAEALGTDTFSLLSPTEDDEKRSPTEGIPPDIINSLKDRDESVYNAIRGILRAIDQTRPSSRKKNA